MKYLKNWEPQKRRSWTSAPGFTLLEVLITVLIASIFIFGLTRPMLEFKRHIENAKRVRMLDQAGQDLLEFVGHDLRNSIGIKITPRFYDIQLDELQWNRWRLRKGRIIVNGEDPIPYPAFVKVVDFRITQEDQYLYHIYIAIEADSTFREHYETIYTKNLAL